jgi:hypothetical protein
VIIMGVLLLLLAFVLLAVAAPFLGKDTSDARSDVARPDAGWFPAAPSSPEDHPVFADAVRPTHV